MLPVLPFVTLALVGVASAQTSLYIPGFDPQPVTADEAGVGADGATTWLIAPGVTSGSFDQDPGFVGTATLIEAATAAELIMSDPEGGGVFDDKCAINGDEADCTLLFVSGTVTITSDLETESAVPFEVQVGASAAATGAASSAPNTASAGSAPASGASQTQSASQTGASTSETGSSTSQAVSVTQSGSTSTSASATPSGNGVAKLGWSGAATLLSGAGVAMMLFV